MRLLWLSFLLFLLRPSEPVLRPAAPPRNVILLIGDGMGLTQVTAAMYAAKGKLHMEKMPVTGLMTVDAEKSRVTDSAASATAMACGCKTKNGMVGVNAKKKPCRNLFEQAKEHGWATGLVVTSSVVHATPAAFVAHVTNRAFQEDIALAFLDSKIDLVIGGGSKYFSGRKNDQRNLESELANKGYQINHRAEIPMQALDFNPEKPLVWFAHPEEPEPVQMGRTYLPYASAQAPAFLQKRSENGFMLMIEGSQIDWAGHQNKAEWLIAETLDFDAAVGEVLRFAEQDGQTLVIVTADHETGGAAIVQGSRPDSLHMAFAGDYHTATMVPVFAYGPGSTLFAGIYDNTDIYFKIKQALGWPEVE